MRTQSGLTYEVFGDGDQAIVACTCWCEATPTIQSLETHWLRRLAQDHTLVVTNRRGFAGSSGKADLDSEILGLREVVDAIGAPAVLLGGCEDAVVPIALAARHPESVRALIVVNGTARFAADEDYPGTSVDVLRPLPAVLRADWESFFRLFMSEVAPIPWTDLDTAFDVFRQFTTGEALAALSESIFLADIRKELDKIVAPTLVVHSTEDKVIPFPQGQYIAAHVKGANLHELQGARHHIDPSFNDEVARAVKDFLENED